MPNARPYDLRHSFVSLLIQEGVSIIEIARQAGHTPTMTLEVYGHVFDELDPAERVSAETQIRLARDESFTRFVSAGPSGGVKIPANHLQPQLLPEDLLHDSSWRDARALPCTRGVVFPAIGARPDQAE